MCIIAIKSTSRCTATFQNFIPDKYQRNLAISFLRFDTALSNRPRIFYLRITLALIFILRPRHSLLTIWSCVVTVCTSPAGDLRIFDVSRFHSQGRTAVPWKAHKHFVLPIITFISVSITPVPSSTLLPSLFCPSKVYLYQPHPVCLFVFSFIFIVHLAVANRFGIVSTCVT